ncbi:signal recognition particle receptor subunit alpha homolog isoform X1 [Bombus vosnesenskii]|uniref:Signal recognition particle receptor subunit alpha homolog isoform X1 n=3 Tax=Pyrobombus TaxID=144703 RepID=A0A6J3KC31_9HYME|nr:signal recognition particle receptor subunit alpha homolog isoform X1 [Bombus impatiens]XP_033193864.1 signal recognition particle receptor subunit alpha homolog isoform X1 [Bombus vancouverensis nearcticus]XP_033304380.1 signal recognition particle receptor subunit alpha homolog isoform X1 [Bombus bifarius]XP_033350693.1 signal recognition particle receptor subunit alpha homolog isoform X1 [Bombus vosnesenskii]XP_050475007.1 signal recognition particle receptor subunit alpha homolog isoform
MLDLFTIFSKGGIVLWCFQSTSQIFAPSVNALIRSVILQERTGNHTFEYDSLRLQYKLDNEFELVFVVAYQKILQLSYVDKFLNDIHLEFRDRFKNELENSKWFYNFEFQNNYEHVLAMAEQWARTQAKIPKQMRTFDESQKSKKTVASMIERKDDKDNKKQGKRKTGVSTNRDDQMKIQEVPKQDLSNNQVNHNGEMDEEVLIANRMKLAQKMNNQKKKADKQKSQKPEKAGKKPRVWELGGTIKDLAALERTKDKPEESGDYVGADKTLVGQMKGGIRDIVVETDSEDESDEEMENPKPQVQKKSNSMFSMFKSLVGNKSLKHEDMAPVLEKLKDHLISKNVAADIAQKLCDSVGVKLEGKVLGTFDSVTSTVKATLTDALVQILSPKRRVDILRDAMEAKKNNRPYVMTFCGVNGVGKSTNLAKICFWLIENNFRVLIAACDTFRAGAVEQLRTHMRHLNALHPPEKHENQSMVQLYEKGYGKDAAGIAMEAIRFAKDLKIDVVLVDTAGRMQDNEPLMRALTKLIKVNEPDLVLFVGEALVGNEAVDQLVKFNQALADHSQSTNPHIIDGIVLTKFDTIDDKVGAAISMTYITGQPIVFVGTGQTYTDLKSLNAKAVVHALMK